VGGGSGAAGRIDLAVELPLPDAEGRRRLLELYARGLDATGVTWEPCDP
jgi:ATP-dependent 26S proteasome regulatory subunit